MKKHKPNCPLAGTHAILCNLYDETTNRTVLITVTQENLVIAIVEGRELKADVDNVQEYGYIEMSYVVKVINNIYKYGVLDEMEDQPINQERTN